MSAYIVSDYQINTIVSWAILNKVWFGGSYITEGRGQQYADVLLQANVDSVNDRYNETTKSSIEFSLNTGDAYTPLQIAKLCDNLEYQSCEADSWDSSVALKLLIAIRSKAITLLPGYDDAPWGIDAPVAKAA